LHHRKNSEHVTNLSECIYNYVGTEE
jgi:hypothetical protein